VFITLEGPEGSGKSTLIEGLGQALRESGISVLTTREPGAGDVGAAIRKILLEGDALSSRAELFLFLADRAQHVEFIIRPALAAGSVVICDRYSDSTVVYQGYGRGLPLEDLRVWCAWASKDLTPDLTILLDLDPSIGLARLKNPDRLDREPLEFHKKIREGFLNESRNNSNRFCVLDASLPAETVQQKALGEVEDRLKRR